MTIVSLFDNSKEINVLRDSGYGAANFDIFEAPISYTVPAHSFVPRDEEHLIPDQKALYRSDNQQFLGMHSRKYQTVSHKSMIDTSRSVLERSELILDGVTEEIRVNETGTMCFVQHNIPNHCVTTPDGDTSSLQLLHINSTNGIWPYQGSVGTLQSACLNHQVFLTGTAGIYKARHTNALNINHGANLISKTVHTMINQNKVWHQWYNTKSTETEAVKLYCEAANLNSLLKMTDQERSEHLMLGEKINSNLTYMLQKHRFYQDTLGKNMWAVYNTLTDWSTHFGKEDSKTTRKNAADANTKFIKRNESVRNVLKHFPIAA